MAQTRAQKRKEEAQAVQEGGQEDQQLNEPENQTPEPEVEKKPKQRRQPPKKKTVPQKKPTEGQPITQGSDRGSPAENQEPSQGRRSRQRSEGSQDTRHLQRTNSGIRKKSASQRQGRTLPRFDVPFWKIRDGVPVIVLRMLASGSETDATNMNEDDLEDMTVDSDSDDESQSEHDNGDALQQDPPPPDRHTGDGPDKAIHVDSQAETPNRYLFPQHPKDNPKCDVRPVRFPIQGFASEEDIEKYGSRLARFIRSPASDLLNEGWYGVKPLGRGSFGVAGLWQKRNDDGEVIDEMVVKQTRKIPGYEWESLKPDEVKCMEYLKKAKASEYVVNLRGYRRYPRREVHRIYMEYCPYGDLDKLIKEYRARKQFVPEKFIWEAFYYLALACRGLETCIPPRKRSPSEHEIVHRDIKPCNIFLGKYPTNAENDFHPAYPAVKLGDFGEIVGTGTEDEHNPLRYRRTGTEGYRALEQEELPTTRDGPYYKRADVRYRHYIRSESNYGNPPQILAHTNVWGIGVTIFELMSLKEAWYYLYNYDDIFNEEDGPEDVDPFLEAITRQVLGDVGGILNRYTDALLDTMLQCLRPDPAMRPKVPELLNTIQRERINWREGGAKDALQEQDIVPIGNFDSLEEGNWEADPGQRYTPLKRGSRFSRSSLKPKKPKEEDPESADESDEEQAGWEPVQ